MSKFDVYIDIVSYGPVGFLTPMSYAKFYSDNGNSWLNNSFYI